MSSCDECGEGIGTIPFDCRACGNVLCPEHRMPENHACARRPLIRP